MNGGDYLIMNSGTGGTSAMGGCITITGGVGGQSVPDYSNCVGTYLGEDLKDPNSLRNSWDNIESALRDMPTVRKYIDNNDGKGCDNTLIEVDTNGTLSFVGNGVSVMDTDGGVLSIKLDETQDQLNDHTEQLNDLDDTVRNLDTAIHNLEMASQGFEDGHYSMPSIRFDNDYGLGMFRKGYGEIGFAVHGGEVGSIDRDGIHFHNIDSRHDALEVRITLLENALMELRAMT